MTQVPAGHPGDLAWRLPVWRTLLKLNLVQPDQLEQVNARSKAGGFFFSHLLALGVNPDRLLTAIAVATGLPGASRMEVRHPRPELAAGLDADRCRSLLAVPFARVDGLLHLALVVPLTKQQLAELPVHKAFIALESDVRDGLDVCFPKVRAARESAPAAAPPVPAPVPTEAAAAFDPSMVELPPPPPAPAAAPPAAPAEPPSRRRSPGTPTAEELKAAGIIETGVDPREDLYASLRRAKWPAIVTLGLALSVWGVTKLIDFSRRETERSGAELGRGIRQLSVDAAKAQQRAMQPGGGGLAEAPLPIPTPAGPPHPRTGVGTFDAVSDAIANLDVAVHQADLRAFRERCLTLASEVRAYGPLAPELRQTSWLAGLASETSALCEREFSQPPAEEWKDLRRRVMSALKGDPP